jgi:hypothetical protein
MDNIQWQSLSAAGGVPVLFLPDCRREVLQLLGTFLEEGAVVARAGELEEVQVALAHLQVQVESQVTLV